jgi:hypothetical protein
MFVLLNKKIKRLLHVRIGQLPGASPPGPPPGLCPGSTGDFKQASKRHSFDCVPRSEIPGSATGHFMKIFLKLLLHCKFNDLYEFFTIGENQNLCNVNTYTIDINTNTRKNKNKNSNLKNM